MTIATFNSLLEIVNQSFEEEVGVDILTTGNESAITRGRSNLAATFLGTNYDVLAFIDADIGITAEDFFRLLDIDAPIRGAAVNLKTKDHSECLNVFSSGKQLKRAEMPDEPFEVDFLGGAVMLIDREVIEKLSSIEMLQYNDPIIGHAAHLFWERILEKTLLSEDYAFCSLARENGFTVVCDPQVIVDHHGPSVWRH